MVGTMYRSLNASDGATSLAALGETYEINGATYQYVKANATITAYQVCYILDDGTISLATAALLTTTKPTNVCVPQFAMASGDYGWAVIGPCFLREDGTTTFKVLSKIAAKNVLMYGTTTPGSVDDAVTNPKISGLQLTAAQTVDDTATAFQATTRMSCNL